MVGGYSPTKETIPTFSPPIPNINNPPSPRTHRALRRLQSAHTLGQSNNQPSLISQQHKESIQRKLSPATTPALPHHSRGRSNSDASNMTAPSASSRRPVVNKKPIAADALSLDRLIRDGPPDGDIVGALESTRLKILDQGIKSDSDGMVGAFHPSHEPMLTVQSHLCESMPGSSCSMRQCSKQTPTSPSFIAVPPPHIPKSATIRSEH